MNHIISKLDSLIEFVIEQSMEKPQQHTVSIYSNNEVLQVYNKLNHQKVLTPGVLKLLTKKHVTCRVQIKSLVAAINNV